MVWIKSPKVSVLVLSLSILLLMSHPMRGQPVELLVNGLFSQGFTAWEIRGDVYPEYGAALYGRPRLPASISQTIARPDLSPDLVLSYRITTTFYITQGNPFVDVKVVGYILNPSIGQDETATLYSIRYNTVIPSSTNTYDVTVNLKEKYAGDPSKPLRRIRVLFEAGFEDTTGMGGIQAVAYGYVHKASLVMTSAAPPPVLSTTTTTVTATTVERTMVTVTVRQSVPLLSSGLSLLIMVLAVVVLLGVIAYSYSRRRVSR